VERLIRFVREQYGTDEYIPLHAPVLGELEKRYVIEALDSGYVSSVGPQVAEFENAIARFTGAKHAVATVNGTAALHVSLVLAGVMPGDEVITQSITFVATCNAIRYCGAHPLLVDIDLATLGMSPDSLAEFLQDNAYLDDRGRCVNRRTGATIRACVPMHNFGHPVRIDAIAAICDRWNLVLIEDTAESLGSSFRGRHTGLFGSHAALSFNGNKIITTGGGGMVITDDDALAARARHITTTAKAKHPWLFVHDEVGFNYRMPALNAALGCAQFERLEGHLARKRMLAECYAEWFSRTDYHFNREPAECRSNYWLNSFLVNSPEERDDVLRQTNALGVMTRPVWTPMHYLELYKDCLRSDLKNSEWLESRLVNLPSSPPGAA